MSPELEYVELARADGSGLITLDGEADDVKSLRKVGRDHVLMEGDGGRFIYPMHRVMKMKVKE